MNTLIRSLSGLLLLGLAAPAAAVTPKLTEIWGRSPLTFEENRGQVHPDVLFLARAPGHEVYLTSAEVVLVPRQGSGALRLRWLDAEPDLRAHPEGALSGRVRYYLGNTPAQWQAEVPLWSHVRLEGLWPGIDAVFYGGPQELEHDFVVAPGADPERIVLLVDGARSQEVDAAGDLLVQLGGGEIRLRKPVAYQKAGDTRREVPCRFRLLSGNRLAFALEAWDRDRPLIIDPVVVWSTHLGGRDEDEARAVATDAAGNLWVTGRTRSPNFPVKGSTPPAAPFADAFVSKLSPWGVPVFSTYLGGRTSIEEAHGIAIDGAGNAWVTGLTASSDFPLVHPVPARYRGDGGEIFVAKFAPDGELLASSHLGGVMDTEHGDGIAVGADGGPWIVGYTFSPDFPVVLPVEPLEHDNPFVMKLSADGSVLQLSTTLGMLDSLSGVAVDPAGQAWLAGSSGGDAAVVGIEPAGPSLVWLAKFGGSGSDESRAISLAPDRSLWVTGMTTSADFPTRGLQIPSPRGAEDIFVVRLRPAGRRMVYAAAFGGTGADEVRAIAVDGSNRVYLAGSTTSADFPLASPFQARCAPVQAGGRCVADAFLLQMTPVHGIAWSSYLGGATPAAGSSLALDEAFGIALHRGNLYAAGRTSSGDFPVASAYQPSFGGGSTDSFVIRLRR